MAGEKKVAPLPPLTVFPSSAWADRDLLESDLRVLGVLCARFNRKTSQCNPSKPSIAVNAGVSVRTVNNALDRLKVKGYIDWTQVRLKDGKQGRNEYVIVPFETDYGIPVMIPHTANPDATQVARGGMQPRVHGPHATAGVPPRMQQLLHDMNIEVEQRRGTENGNTGARIRERSIIKGKNPSDDIEVIADAS
jgi:hypothetical protein